MVKAVIETENGILLDIDINMACAHDMPPCQVFGKYGSAIESQRVWKARYFRPEELEDVKVQEGLAALNRKYGSGENIPWREESFPLSDFQQLNYYDKCYEYYALDNPPFVPVSETREVMRVLHECRRDSSGI